MLGTVKGHKSNNLESGFTLIELLVVILIIGILSSIAIPVFLNQRKTASDASLKSDMRNVATAIETWQAKTGQIAGDMQTGENAWSIILRHKPTTPTMSLVSAGEFYPEEFDPPEMSDGNAIGVLTGMAQGSGGGGYCISGNNEGGSYKSTSPSHPDKRKHALYYDSLKGGFFEAKELPEDGACRYNYLMM